MTMQEYRRIQAERAALENLLDQLPASSVIERRGLEFRKNKVDKILASQPASRRDPVRVRLTFRGRPAVGTRGLFADFGATAVKAFTDAIAAVGASRNAPLKFRGAIPRREKYRLLITGTALGSFGFELEEASRGDLFPESSPVDLAVERTISILEATRIETDDGLTDAVSDTHPRALALLRAFLKKMADKEATCALEFKDRAFRFVDVSEVRRSERRLSMDYISYEEQELSGSFQGMLPARRTFEFLNDTTGRVISGSIDFTVVNADEINGILNRPVRINVVSRQVGAASKRYVLLSYRLVRSNGESGENDRFGGTRKSRERPRQ